MVKQNKLLVFIGKLKLKGELLSFFAGGWKQRARFTVSQMQTFEEGELQRQLSVDQLLPVLTLLLVSLPVNVKSCRCFFFLFASFQFDKDARRSLQHAASLII